MPEQRRYWVKILQRSCYCHEKEYAYITELISSIKFDVTIEKYFSRHILYWIGIFLRISSVSFSLLIIFRGYRTITLLFNEFHICSFVSFRLLILKQGSLKIKLYKFMYKILSAARRRATEVWEVGEGRRAPCQGKSQTGSLQVDRSGKLWNTCCTSEWSPPKAKEISSDLYTSHSLAEAADSNDKECKRPEHNIRFFSESIIFKMQQNVRNRFPQKEYTHWLSNTKWSSQQKYTHNIIHIISEYLRIYMCVYVYVYDACMHVTTINIKESMNTSPATKPSTYLSSPQDFLE